MNRKSQWWDTATPYHNVRIEEREDYDILVVGGEDHNSGMKLEDYQDAHSNLEKWAKKRWTSAGEVLYKWTGQASISYLRVDINLNTKNGKEIDYLRGCIKRIYE